MKRFKWQIIIGMCFLLISSIVYTFHYLIFEDHVYIFRFVLSQLGFLPISVFLVTIVINQLLAIRDKKNTLRKLNMVIGTFFSEVGADLLKIFSELDSNSKALKKQLALSDQWSKKTFDNTCKRINNHDVKINSQNISQDLVRLRDFLHEKRSFLLGLLQNPNLLEHEAFTDLLWAVFHLTEELVSRENVGELSEQDIEHLENDIARAYSRLIYQWLSYMQHLKEDYPYLFSYAVRMNPFDPEASPEIK